MANAVLIIPLSADELEGRAAHGAMAASAVYTIYNLSYMWFASVGVVNKSRWKQHPHTDRWSFTIPEKEARPAAMVSIRVLVLNSFQF